MGRFSRCLKPFTRRGVAGLFLVAGMGLLTAGCNEGGPEIIPREEIKSPDGYWTVKTQLERWSGPGNNALAATVYLSRTGEHDEPQLLLSLDIPSQDKADVVVTWRDKRHLELLYRKGMTVNFQVVKSAGVDISTTEAAL